MATGLSRRTMRRYVGLFKAGKCWKHGASLTDRSDIDGVTCPHGCLVTNTERSRFACRVQRYGVYGAFE